MRAVKRKRIWIAAAFAAIAVVLAVFAFDSRLIVRNYDIDAGIGTDVRIALVTDLHSCRYGEGQYTLLRIIYEQDPDIVLLGGDIFDDKLPDTNTENFLSVVSQDYPCYYVTGNHEYWSGGEKFAAKIGILEKHGVAVLSGEYETVDIGGKSINICGIDDPDVYLVDENYSSEAQLAAAAKAMENGNYSLLLAHRPENFDVYAAYDFDLVLSGHAHGGQWRIPGLVNGLYAPSQGIFPEYAGGKYEKNGTTMIVSRGLARESTKIPRIFNRPELVVVEIH